MSDPDTRPDRGPSDPRALRGGSRALRRRRWLQIRIVGIDDLLAMKRAAGRPQGVRDIATLTHIEREWRSG